MGKLDGKAGTSRESNCSWMVDSRKWFWQMEVSLCERLLDHLVREGSLCKTDNGFYVASETRRR